MDHPQTARATHHLLSGGAHTSPILVGANSARLQQEDPHPERRAEDPQGWGRQRQNAGVSILGAEKSGNTSKYILLLPLQPPTPQPLMSPNSYHPLNLCPPTICQQSPSPPRPALSPKLQNCVYSCPLGMSTKTSKVPRLYLHT